MVQTKVLIVEEVDDQAFNEVACWGDTEEEEKVAHGYPVLNVEDSAFLL